MNDRMEKVSAAVKREICVILQDEVNDPRIKELTITRVEVTRDLRLAKIYYIVFASDNEKQAIRRGFQDAARFLRKRLAKKISMKYTPELSFREDKAEEREESVDTLFEKIKEEFARGAENTESEEQSE